MVADVLINVSETTAQNNRQELMHFFPNYHIPQRLLILIFEEKVFDTG